MGRQKLKVRGTRAQLSRVPLAVLFVVAIVFVARGSWACVGDCNRDGSVTIEEILTGVNIALGAADPARCASMDRDGDATVTVDEIIGAVNNALSGCPLESIIPPNYAQTFIEVRDCRLSTEHEGYYIRVLTDAAGAQLYRENAPSLPVGTVVVKEEYNRPDCRADSLVRWSAMRKELDGFEPTGSNWHWQRVLRDGTIVADGKETCIGCHVRPACSTRDFMCTEAGPPKGTMSFVIRSLPAALTSITGSSVEDVYVVGADPPNDSFGPYVLHYDGQRWRRLNTGAQGDLWWISVEPIDGAYYLVGEGGLVLRYDLNAKQFTRLVTPASATLFGVWGTSAANIFVVGGDPNDETGGGVLWHFDGVVWSAVDLSGVLPTGVPTLYKVWGRSADDVYAVGQSGTVLHFDGEQWTRVQANSRRPLFTVHGNGNLVVASGGFAEGVLLEFEGQMFVDRAMPGTPQMNGVFVRGSLAAAVGVGASLSLRSPTGWDIVDTKLNTSRDFHAVWIDPEGGLWAVGGDLSVALSAGMVAYSGSRTIGSDVLDISPCPAPEDPPPPDATVSFSQDILPILQNRGCQSPACHGGPFPSSGYDLRTYAGMFGPGVWARSLNGCEIVPGNPDASLLLEKLGPTPRFGQRMPLGREPLSADEMEILRRWILEGARSDFTPPAEPSPTPSSSPSPTPSPGMTENCDTAGVICTTMGTGKALFDGDGKPALETSLYFPWSVAFDAQGRPLVVDANNLRLRRLEADGTVTTVMGTGIEAFPVDGTPAVETPLHHASEVQLDNEGRWLIAGNHVPAVFRVNQDGRVYRVAGQEEVGNDGDGQAALSAKLTTPFGVCPSQRGGFYIADIDAHVIRYVDAAGVIHTVAGSGVAGYAGDGGPATQARLNGPARVREDREGNLYFVEVRNHVVRRVDRNGTISTVAGLGARGYSGDGGPALQARLDSPYDLLVLPDGGLLIVDTGNSAIRWIDQSGTIRTVVGGRSVGFGGDGRDARSASLSRPVGAGLAPDGSLWIADTFNNRVRRVADFVTWIHSW
ncbi:MAG: hypothetical protein N3C12_09485 [Candidatus Binatia bacterium]|nr:hypothetical protein [Candidatus Binatia bacterium]